MNIRLHIERLILEGLPVGHGQGALIKAAVEAELGRLLVDGGLARGLQSGGALPNIRAGSIELHVMDNPVQLGGKIAHSVYVGIGEAK